MKIISLEINSFKKFNKSIKVNLENEINLLIGVNGSGKSTILEALAIIFSSVKKYCESRDAISEGFNFEIEYFFIKKNILESTTTTGADIANIHHVKLSGNNDNGMHFNMEVGEKPLRSKKEILNYLPDNLIFYYAGFNETLKNIVREIEISQANKLKFMKDEDSQRNVPELLSKAIIYIKKKHFPLLFLLNYLGEKSFELPTSRIHYVYSFIILHIKRPSSFGKKFTAASLYGLTGFLKTYLISLLNYSQPLEINDDDDTAQIRIDFDLGFLSALSDLGEWSNDIYFENHHYLLFHVFNLLLEIGFLEEIEIKITKRDSDNLSVIDINHLSEGEQQLITINTIKKCILKDNSVLVMDEPDAFLHPKKQRDLIPHLKDNVFTESHHQIILASHSPFIAQSIPLDCIRIFDINAKNPITPEGSLLSYPAISREIFNLRGEFSKEIENELEVFRQYRDTILKKKKFNKTDFIKLAKSIAAKGEETEVIISRELRQLETLTDQKFNL